MASAGTSLLYVASQQTLVTARTLPLYVASGAVMASGGTTLLLPVMKLLLELEQHCFY